MFPIYNLINNNKKEFVKLLKYPIKLTDSSLYRLFAQLAEDVEDELKRIYKQKTNIQNAHKDKDMNLEEKAVDTLLENLKKRVLYYHEAEIAEYLNLDTKKRIGKPATKKRNRDYKKESKSNILEKPCKNIEAEKQKPNPATNINTPISEYEKRLDNLFKIGD